jgi:hypothetical protein
VEMDQTITSKTVRKYLREDRRGGYWRFKTFAIAFFPSCMKIAFIAGTHQSGNMEIYYRLNYLLFANISWRSHFTNTLPDSCDGFEQSSAGFLCSSITMLWNEEIR